MCAHQRAAQLSIILYKDVYMMSEACADCLCAHTISFSCKSMQCTCVQLAAVLAFMPNDKHSCSEASHVLLAAGMVMRLAIYPLQQSCKCCNNSRQTATDNPRCVQQPPHCLPYRKSTAVCLLLFLHLQLCCDGCKASSSFRRCY